MGKHNIEVRVVFKDTHEPAPTIVQPGTEPQVSDDMRLLFATAYGELKPVLWPLCEREDEVGNLVTDVCVGLEHIILAALDRNYNADALNARAILNQAKAILNATPFKNRKEIEAIDHALDIFERRVFRPIAEAQRIAAIRQGLSDGQGGMSNWP